MNSIDVLHDVVQRPLDDAERLLPRLSADRLNAHPHHDNSPAWLLWHAARQLDEQLAALSGEPTVWVAQGFEEKFALELPPHDLGFGHTPQQARAIRIDDAELLIDHLRAVVEAQQAYLGTLSGADLDAVFDESWDPPVTRSARLVSMSLDAVAHLAQVQYVLGMGTAAFERGFE